MRGREIRSEEGWSFNLKAETAHTCSFGYRLRSPQVLLLSKAVKSVGQIRKELRSIFRSLCLPFRTQDTWKTGVGKNVKRFPSCSLPFCPSVWFSVSKSRRHRIPLSLPILRFLLAVKSGKSRGCDKNVGSEQNTRAESVIHIRGGEAGIERWI